MTSYGDLNTMNRNVLLTPRLWLYLQKDFQQDGGHSLDLEQKQKWYSTCVGQTTRRMGQSRWIDDDQNSEKADTQFSDPRVHFPEERSKAKEVENYRYTSVPMEIRLKLFFAQLFLLISSISTEQSQICVMNTVFVKQERWDPSCQDNLTHCWSQQDCWWQHAHLRLKFLRLFCKSTKNEWKGSHNRTDWSKFVLMQDSRKQLKSDSTSWQRTLKSSHNFTEPVTCREYTLPRDENLSEPKGWIRGNTKIGPRVRSHNQLPAR